MGLSTKADDWQCLCIMQIGEAALVGAGSFVFDFYSSKANISARMTLSGYGPGVGGNLGGMGEVTLNPNDGWSTLTCDTPFSIRGLNGADGWFRSVGVGVGITFSLTDISARRPNADGYLFEEQSISGFGMGLGASAFAFKGVWGFARVGRNKPPSPYWA